MALPTITSFKHVARPLRTFPQYLRLHLRTLFFKKSLSSSIYTLGIESSFDDTAVGIVSSDGTVLANCVRGQSDSHLATGGIIK